MDGSSSEEYLSADEELDSINGITSVKRDHSVEDVEDRDRECVETGEKSPPAICHLPPTSILTTMASSARNPLASSTDDPPVVPSSTDDPLPSPVVPSSTDDPLPPPVVPSSTDDPLPPPVVPSSTDNPLPPPVVPSSTDDPLPPPVVPSSTDDPLPPPVVPSSTDDPLPPPVVPSSTDDPLPPPVVPSSTDDPLPPPVVPSLADDSADNLPVPPPRRKRKKKSEKQSSLDNNVDDAFSMTVTTDLSKERPSKTLGQPSSQERSPSPLQEGSPSPPQQEDSKGAGLVVVKGSQDEGTDDNDSHHTIIMSSSDSLLQDRISRSRSATPTPGISIEPDVGLDWTKDMLSTPRSEVVTSDTSLSKARGSNTTTTSSLAFQSDDDSVDGDQVFADDTPEEGCDSEGGGAEPKPPKPAVSGSSDSDNAILASTMVTNLDTGEVIPLSAAEEKIPQGHGWSPLSEHLIQRTAEAEGQCYEEDYIPHQRKGRRKTFIKLKKWGRRRERMGGDEGPTQLDEAGVTEDRFAVKYKQGSHKQNNQEFDKVRLKQDLTGIHLGAIWSMEFSICGRLLATAGQDSVVRVWVLATAAIFFHELQAQYQRLGVHSSVDSLSEKASVASSGSKSSEEDDNQGGKLPFQEQPLCSYYGHTADVLDLSWSKNFFLLSSSMDKTVRLWHISRKECLCCFQHVDFVTAIAFHPRDDRYFLSGSLDGKLRLWNIPDKRVALWNEIEGVGSHLITAANFCMNGKLAVVGTYDGRCMFYDTEHLKYHTQIHVKSRHGKNKGRKISGVEPLPGEDKLLVTSNDSRIRLYNLKDHELACKYKGCLNTSSQIKATFSRDGQYIISGSEDNFIYLWKTHLDISKLSSTRRDRNEFYESFSSHSAPVTTAVFAPVPGITVDEGIKEVGEMIVAADYQGAIKIYVSGEKL